MEAFLSWLWQQAPSIITAAAVIGAINLAYQIRRDRRQKRAARETIHGILRPVFQDLEEHVRNRYRRTDGRYSELGAVASGWFKEIKDLVAQHSEKLPKNERDILMNAIERTRKMEPPTSGVQPADYTAARDALTKAVALLKEDGAKKA